MLTEAPQSSSKRTDRRRRRHARHRGDFRVKVSYFDADRLTTIDGHCRDLSEAGIGILLAAELKSGEVVSLSFLLPGSLTTSEVRAVVRYRHGYHYGFEFLAASQEQQQLFKTYIKTQPVVN